MAVPRCPVCQAEGMILFFAPTKRAVCSKCGTRWFQDGPKVAGILPRQENPFHPSMQSRDTT
jgi:hypothetical protein